MPNEKDRFLTDLGSAFHFLYSDIPELKYPSESAWKQMKKKSEPAKPVCFDPAIVKVGGIEYKSILGIDSGKYQLKQNPKIRDFPVEGYLDFVAAGYTQTVSFGGREFSRQEFYNSWFAAVAAAQGQPLNYVVALDPEPENPYDSNAVNLRFKSEEPELSQWNGLSIGYVPAKISGYIANNLALVKFVSIVDTLNLGDDNDILGARIKIEYINSTMESNQFSRFKNIML